MNNENVVAKKRGRKPKNQVIEESQNPTLDKKEEIIPFLPEDEDVVEDDLKTPIIKKRGRKPKGGKIIQNINTSSDGNSNPKPSVILHLKCCLKDLETNVMNSNVEPFNFSSNKHDLSKSIKLPKYFDVITEGLNHNVILSSFSAFCYLIQVSK
jgi:hypothetical protein